MVNGEMWNSVSESNPKTIILGFILFFYIFTLVIKFVKDLCCFEV